MKNSWITTLEDGFTILEALAAIIIISLGSFLLVFGGQRMLVNIIKFQTERIFLSELQLCSEILKESVNQIEIPFWQSEMDIQFDSNLVSIPFYQGYPDRYLDLSFNNNGFYITYPPDSTIFFNSITNGFITPLMKNGLVVGVSLEITKESIVYKSQALFGSVALISIEDIYE